MTAVFYPRITDEVAQALIESLSGLSHPELVAGSALSHRAAAFYPTRSVEVSPETLMTLQVGVRRIASECGYPSSTSRRSTALRLFDQQCCSFLFKEMNIMVADAANDGVWSFLSLVLLPDVALWRYPNEKSRDDYERLLGRPRNVFRRLWWRAHNLGVDLGPLLLEDEAVGIMERPNIGGNPLLARAIAREHLTRVQRNSALPRTEILRDGMKRMRRLAAVISLSGLESVELEEVVSEVFDRSVQALS